MKVGFDVHGCITLYPEIFMKLSRGLLDMGHEVHIITGQEQSKIESKVRELNISFTHFFSIVDYHKNIGTEMWVDEKGTFWMEEDTWNRSKGDYIFREKIDVHFDDNYEYVNYIPDSCTVIIVPRIGFDKFMSTFIWSKNEN